MHKSNIVRMFWILKVLALSEPKGTLEEHWSNPFTFNIGKLRSREERGLVKVMLQELGKQGGIFSGLWLQVVM